MKLTLIPNDLFGFRKNFNTIEQVRRMVNNIIYCIGKDNYCIAVFLDVEKVFDKVCHERVLKNL